MKNAIIPDIFVGLESKTSNWTNGVGIDFKSIKPDVNYVTSLSAVAYIQYVNSKFQLKAKAIYGENLSDNLMLGGFGVSKYGTDSTTVLKYTNFKNLSAWLNVVYGTKVQVGLLFGISKNLGTNENLDVRKGGKYSAYGFGYYDATQLIIDHLIRVAPQVSYNLTNVKLGLEYDFSTVSYGTIQKTGRVVNPYSVDNHRLLASLCYYF